MRAPGGMLAALALVGAVLWPAPVAVAQASDPPFSVDEQALDESLDCPEFAHPDREPVLLVHGTGTHGHEQFDWNWLAVLPGMGFDVCVVTYPDRGLGDQQVSAEYVAHAVMTMAERSGRQVDLMGHSQGASMPRWAVKFWPSVRDAIDDYVGIAGPYHGTSIVGPGAGGTDGGSRLQPAALYQFPADSNFTTILNEGDETPGEIDWTNLATAFDELVQPTDTAFLDRGQDNPRVTNVLLQDLCPARVVDHLSIGTTDRLAFDLAVDAFTHDGPADPARLGLGPECSIADQIVEDPQQVTSIADLLLLGLERGLPDLHLTDREPPTRDYARADGDDEPAPDDADTADDTDTADESEAAVPTPAGTAEPAPAPAPVTAPVAVPASRPLPATGGGLAVLGLAGVLGGVVSRRRRRPGETGRG